MLTDRGIVKAVGVDSVLVEAQVKSTCAGCDAKSSCGAGLIARAFTQKTQMLTVEGCFKLKTGDTVQFGVDQSSILRASFWVYLMPIFCLIAGATFFSWLNRFTFEHEFVTILGSVLAGYLGFRVAKRKLSEKEKEIQIKFIEQ